METTRRPPLKVDERLIGHEFEPQRWSWTEHDAILYALGVGARVETDLDFLYERRGPLVLPTFAVIPATRFMDAAIGELDIDLANVLHGEQSVELHAAVPPRGEVTTTGRVVDVHDKGDAAVIECEYVSSAGADPLFTTRASCWVRGAGGFLGEERSRSAARRSEPPGRSPDRVLEEQTWPELPALYRLSGDLNPIHIDPEFARAAGFDRPFLHGLCTFGIVGRSLVHGLCGGNPARLRTFEARFTNLVFPGETLRTEVWLEAGGDATLRTSTARGIVLGRARATFIVDA